MGDQNKGFSWTAERQKAALLFGQKNLKRWEIAERLHCSISTIDKWLANPQFRDRVKSIEDRIAAEAERVGIVNRVQIMINSNARYRDLMRIQQARADDKTYADVPGYKTGLLVHDFKMIGQGKNARMVPTFSIDSALLKECRELEKHVMMLIGQWTSKVQLLNPGTNPNDAADPDCQAQAEAAMLAAQKHTHSQEEDTDEPD